MNSAIDIIKLSSDLCLWSSRSGLNFPIELKNDVLKFIDQRSNKGMIKSKEYVNWNRKLAINSLLYCCCQRKISNREYSSLELELTRLI